MKIVIDANILFSGLLRDSRTRRLILDRRLSLFAPRFLVVEFAKYSNELRDKSGLGKKDFASLARKLIGRIGLVSDGEILLYYSPADSLVSDKKDVPYAACALAIGADIWSNNRHFSGSRIRAWTTKELIEKMGK